MHNRWFLLKSVCFVVNGSHRMTLQAMPAANAKKMLTETFESLLGECFTSEERFILNEIYDGLEF